jgi:uncharacterized protein (UPF0335 family)
MAVSDESQLLREAKDIYGALTRQIGGKHDGAGSSSDNPIGSLNKRVMSAVNGTVQQPLLCLLNDVHKGAETSRDVGMALCNLPGPMQKDLEALPASLKVDDLTTYLLSNVSNVLDEMKSVSSNPKGLYPRLICGSIPVDPAKLTNLAKKYGALDASDGNEATRAMRGPPGSSADVVAGFSISFRNVAEPLHSGIVKLCNIREKVARVSQTASSIGGSDGALGDLLSQQEKVGEMVEVLTGIFAKNGPDTPKSGSSGTARGLDSPETNVLSIVEEGSNMIHSADKFRGPLEKSIERVKQLGDMLAGLGDELKDLFHSAMEAIGVVVEQIRAFIANMPRLLSEVKQFFVPSGVRALFLTTSPQTASLLAGMEKLSTAVPDPDQLHSTARSVFDQSESLSTVELIKSKIVDVVRIPTDLIAKLALISEELPAKILAAAKAALKAWAEEYGENAIRAKIEDGICDAAEAVAGEKLADALGHLLPFGKGSEKSQKPFGSGKSQKHTISSMLTSLF